MERKKKKTNKIISIFLLAQVILWVGCAFFNIYTSNASEMRKISVTALMFLNAGVFLILTLLVGKSKPVVFFITVGVLLLNAALLLAGGLTGWEYIALALIAVSLGLYLWFNVKKVYFKIKERVEKYIEKQSEFFEICAKGITAI